MGKQLPTCAGMILGALLLMGPGARAIAAPPPSSSTEQPSLPVWLDFDSGSLDANAKERLHEQLSAKLVPVFEDAGMHLVDTADLAARTLRVRVVSFDATRRDYEVQLELLGRDETSKVPSSKCDACSEARLVALVAEDTAALLSGPIAADESAPCPAPSPQPSPANLDTRGPPRERTVGSLGIAGAALLGSGVLTIAAGTYFAVDRAIALPKRTEHPDKIVAEPAMGPITIAVGAVAAGVGATLLAVDIKRQKKRRTVAFQVTPTYWGINITRRF